MRQTDWIHKQKKVYKSLGLWVTYFHHLTKLHIKKKASLTTVFNKFLIIHKILIQNNNNTQKSVILVLIENEEEWEWKRIERVYIEKFQVLKISSLCEVWFAVNLIARNFKYKNKDIVFFFPK